MEESLEESLEELLEEFEESSSESLDAEDEDEELEDVSPPRFLFNDLERELDACCVEGFFSFLRVAFCSVQAIHIQGQIKILERRSPPSFEALRFVDDRELSTLILNNIEIIVRTIQVPKCAQTHQTRSPSLNTPTSVSFNSSKSSNTRTISCAITCAELRSGR